MEQLFSVVARNSFFSTLGKLGIKAISFLFTIVIIRWLGDGGYGRYSLIWSYVIVFAMLSDAGLSLYAIREIAKKKHNSQYLIANIIIIRLLLVIITMALIMMTVRLAGYSGLFLQQVFLASTVLLLYAVQDPLDALLQAHERFDLSTAAIAVGQIVFVYFGGILLVAGWHITGLIVAGLLNVFVSAALAWRFTANYRASLQWRFKPKLWPGVIREAISFGLIKLWLSWWLKIDIIILSWFWLDKMVGWYGAAFAIILGVIVVSNSINAALYPTLSRQFTGDPQAIPEIYELALKYLLVMSLPIAAGIFLTSRAAVNILYGPEFAPAATALAILIWVIPLAFVSEFLRYALLATNREKAAVQILGLVILFSIGLNLWLIRNYGFLGAATVAVISEAVLLFLYSRPLRVELRSISRVNAILKPILATLVMMGAVQLSSSLGLIAQISLGVFVYLFAIGLLGIVNSYEYKLLLSLLKHPRESLLPTMLKKSTPAPLVSVFIPSYNAGPFLAQAIDSVLAQTYHNFELIIIDDGSTDDTVQILEKYQDHPQVTSHRNPKNVGMAANWNIGLKLCRGELIAKLDADDFYEPNYLRAAVEFLQNNREVGLVFTGLNLIYPDHRKEPEMVYLSSWVRDRESFLPDLLELCVIRSPTVCARRECYDRLGAFTEQMRIHADWEMWVRIAANYPVGFMARILANYRLSYGSNCTAQAAIDGRSMEDIKIWLEMLAAGELPYRLSPTEEQKFRWGIYQLEMHFAGMAAYNQQQEMQKIYTTFAEQLLPNRPSPHEIERMRQVYINLHQGILAFRDNRLKEARRYFLQAIKIGPAYCKPLWIWSKLLLTFVGKTKWGVMYR